MWQTYHNSIIKKKKKIMSLKCSIVYIALCILECLPKKNDRIATKKVNFWQHTLLSPVEPFNEASTLSLSALANPQILYIREPFLASGLDWEGGTVVLGRLRQLSILNLGSIHTPLDHESFLGRNLGHTRMSRYRWMKVPLWCAVSEPPCSSQDGWGGDRTVVIGRRSLSA